MLYKVSAVIPAYNAARTINAALESVIDQTYEVFEIIVVDDGSTDNTRDVVSQFSQVKYIYQENKGPSASRNRGIMESTGDLIAFLDADDVWLPEKLAIQVERFRKNPSLGLCASASYICDENLENRQIHRFLLSDQRQILRQLACSNRFSTPAVMARRECFDKVGLFDESLRCGEDWDMWLRIGSECEIDYIDQPLCCCRTLESGITGRGNFDNIRDIKRLIDLNRARLRGWYPKTVGYLKAMSMFYITRAYVFRNAGLSGSAQKDFIKAMVYWPPHSYLCGKAIIATLNIHTR